MPAIASSTSWPMVGCWRLRLQVRPARLGRHPEDVQRAVLVRVLGVGALRLLGVELGVLLLEGVGDVLEEDQAEDDVLVLGRVHVAAQRVGHLPELRLRSRRWRRWLWLSRHALVWALWSYLEHRKAACQGKGAPGTVFAPCKTRQSTLSSDARVDDGLRECVQAFASASWRCLSVLPSFVFQSVRPFAEYPRTTPAAVDGEAKT